MSRILIAAAHKSSGKTTVSIGLCATYHRQGLRVQPFKKGPDYIDPLWLGKAAAQACYNLDFNTASPDHIRRFYLQRAAGADLALVEGNKGLHDGVAIDGSNSNAALAALLDVPVVLVLDTRGMTRGVAPLLRGFAEFDPSISVAGVILNQVGGPRHEGKLREAVETYTDIPVLGALRANADLRIVERHLGLVPGNEQDDAQATIDRIADAVAEQVDLQRLRALGGKPVEPGPVLERAMAIPATGRPRIAIAKDSAFGFYYADDLEALQASGAELVFFSPLRDTRLPVADALFLGGGFPETHAEALAANTGMRREVAKAVEAGCPVYAECGGLMYLARSITWEDRSWPMVGVIPGDVIMHDRPQGRGYARVSATANHPWMTSLDQASVAAHEFHYSSIVGLPENLRYAWRVGRGHGIDGIQDGYVYKNLLASYVHLRNTDDFRWTDRFIDFIRRAGSVAAPPDPDTQTGADHDHSHSGRH